MAIIAQNLRPFVPPLLLDQYGNYVGVSVTFVSVPPSGSLTANFPCALDVIVSVCLRFGPPTTDFIFDAIIARLWGKPSSAPS